MENSIMSNKKRTSVWALLMQVSALFYGKKYSKCKHQHVELIGVHPVTMSPQSGKCRDCKKLVYAHIIWKENKC